MSKQYKFPDGFHPENKPQLHKMPNKPVQRRETRVVVQSHPKYKTLLKEDLMAVDFDYIELENCFESCDDIFVLYKDVIEINNNYEEELEIYNKECEKLVKENESIQAHIHEFNRYYKLHEQMISELIKDKIKETYGEKHVKNN